MKRYRICQVNFVACTAVSYKVNPIFIIILCKTYIFFLVAYLLWRQLGLKKNRYSALFNTEKKNGNDATVLRLIEIFAEERKS